MGIEAILHKLSMLNSLLAYTPVLHSLYGKGVFTKVCVMGGLITFGLASVRLARPLLTGGIHAIWKENRALLVELVLLGALVVNPVVYKELSMAALSGLKAVSDVVFGQALWTFQADFRYFLANIAQRGGDGVNFFNVDFGATAQVFLLSVSLTLTVLLYFLIVSFAPFFVVTAALAGPVILPFGILWPGVRRAWVKFLIASGLIPFCTGMALFVLNKQDILSAAGHFSFEGLLMLALALAGAFLFFATAVPVTIGFLFEARPIAYVGQGAGLIMSALGLLPVGGWVNGLALVLFGRKQRVKGKGRMRG